MYIFVEITQFPYGNKSNKQNDNNNRKKYYIILNKFQF